MLRELQLGEPVLQADNGHLYEIRDASSVDFHILSLWFQTRAVTGRTGGLSTIARQHHTILNLVLILFHHLEESVNTGFLLGAAVRGQTVPQPVFLLLGQVVIRFEDREVVVGRMTDEPVLPFAHLLAVPANHATIIDRQTCVGDDQMLVDTHHLAKALALRTGTCG